MLGQVSICQMANHNLAAFVIKKTFENFSNGPTSTRIAKLSNISLVNLAIFDMKGSNVRQMNLGVLGTGFHKILWDGKNNLGSELPSGIYMAVLEVGEKLNIQKISLIK